VPFTVQELYDTLVPYRHYRRDLGIETMCLLGLESLETAGRAGGRSVLSRTQRRCLRPLLTGGSAAGAGRSAGGSSGTGRAAPAASCRRRPAATSGSPSAS
jgi:hypothetical protein